MILRLLLLLLLGAIGAAGDAPSATAADVVRPPDARAATAAPVTPSGILPIPASASAPATALSISIGGGDGRGLSTAVVILLTITALAVAPAFLMMMTCFTRIIIVLGFVRRALGTQTLPPNQVMLGLALFMSLFIMAPTISRMHQEAWTPWQEQRISEAEALDRAKGTLRDFMLKQTRKGDLALFLRLSGSPRPQSAAEVPFAALVPAFITSELKTAFQMGFIIFLPFLVIDLVVSAVLMAMGMMMLPPVVVSLPFKILLFVLVDGWTLLVTGLVASYR